MHPNPAFRKTPDEPNLDFARERGFGILSVNHDPSPLLAHVPFLLGRDGASLELHLVRSNPILKEMPSEAVIAVSGPDSYISPDWYEVPDQVPTWNYVAVHLRGRIEPQPQERIRDLLDRQSAMFEGQLAPKAPWTTGKMTPEVLEKMMRMIVPCRMEITSVDGTWKLGQNKPDEVRLNAGREVAGYGIGQEVRTLAGLMLGAGKE